MCGVDDYIVKPGGRAGLSSALGPREVFTEEKIFEQVPEGPVRQEGKGKALWAEHLGGAKALGYQSWVCGMPGKQSGGSAMSTGQVEGDNAEEVGWPRASQP